MTLKEFFVEYPDIAVAFSGGVDSSYLLYAAKQYAKHVRAYFVKTPFQPLFELTDAQRLAWELGVELVVIGHDVLQNDDVRENSPLRCYHCKKELFTLLSQYAREDGFVTLIDGTNASDSALDRPGMRALEELQVLSPLRLCGLTKREIIALSKEAGLFTWDKPAYACLATRVPEGTAITREMLEKIEQAEDMLFQLGFRDFRVRLMGDAAKLQLRGEDMARALERKQEIIGALENDFCDILLDLKGR